MSILYGNWHIDTHWVSFLPSGMIYNLIFTFSISLSMASCQRLFLIFFLIATASLTVLGSLSPNLWVLLRYWALHCFTMNIILSYLIKTWQPYQLKARSFWMSTLWHIWQPGLSATPWDWVILPWCVAVLSLATNVPTSCWLSKSFSPLTTPFWSSAMRSESFFMIDKHF